MPVVMNIETCPRWETPPPHTRQMGLLFDPDLNQTQQISAGIVEIPPGQEQTKLSVHRGEEIYLVLEGEGQFVLDDERIAVTKHCAVYIRPGVRHRAINTGAGRLLLYFVNCPSVLRELPGGYRELVQSWNALR